MWILIFVLINLFNQHYPTYTYCIQHYPTNTLSNLNHGNANELEIEILTLYLFGIILDIVITIIIIIITIFTIIITIIITVVVVVPMSLSFIIHQSIQSTTKISTKTISFSWPTSLSTSHFNQIQMSKSNFNQIQTSKSNKQTSPLSKQPCQSITSIIDPHKRCQHRHYH